MHTMLLSVRQVSIVTPTLSDGDLDAVRFSTHSHTCHPSISHTAMAGNQVDGISDLSGKQNQ